MSKFTSFSALLCALVLGTPAFAQECCESYAVYEMPSFCCQTNYVEYVRQPVVPTYTGFSQPMFTEEFVSDEVVEGFASEEVVMDEGPEIVSFEEAVVVDTPVVYEEQLFWNGCYWQVMMVAVPDMQGEQVVYQEGDVYTVGRVTYVDDPIEGEVISETPDDDMAIPSEDLNKDLATDRDDDEVQADDDDFDDGDPGDGDSDEDIDDEDDGLADK